MNALAWLEGPLSVRLVLSLFHLLWLGCLISLFSAAVDSLCRSVSSRIKYAAHVAALLLMFACLPITFILLPVPSPSASAPDHSLSPAVADPIPIPIATHSPHASPSPADRDSDKLVSSEIVESTFRGSDEEIAFARASKLAREGASSKIDAQPPVHVLNSVQDRLSFAWLIPCSPYVSALYLAGILSMSIRFLVAFRGGQRLRRSAIPVEDSALLAMIERQSRRIGLRVAPALAYCQEISVPVVVGILKPMVLLPATIASGLTPDQLQSLLTHELAHLRRLDPVVNLLQRLIEAVLFFHPAVWYINRRIEAERENASDDLVLELGFPRLIYADALVRMAELSVVLRTGYPLAPQSTIAASGGSSSEFKRRVLRLIGGEPAHFRLTNWGVFTLLIAITLAAGTVLFVSTGAATALDDPAAESAEGSRVGRRIANFQLRDYLGAEHKLQDFASSRLVVVAFLGTDCPLAKLYGPRLDELAEKYRPRGVTFLGINSNQQDTPTEIAHYVRRHGIRFPLLKDPGNRIADQFLAQRTPEVFLLDEQREVRYWGGIDDQFGVGYSRPEPTRMFLADAIEDLLAGRKVAVPESKSAGCHIGRVVRKQPTGEITYTNQIARILQNRCVECHREGGIAPFAMDSYAEVAGWAETIHEVVADQRMPPWHANPQFGRFSNDHRMPDEEKQVLYQWVENGIPEGSPADLPAAKQFVDGWSLGRPDLVVEMPEPFTVAADGVVPYRYFTVDPGFSDGKWVRASEIRPGVRSVVHHAIVFIDPPGGDPILEERGVGFEMVGSYVPGTPPMQLEEGVARYVPAGSKFVFQMHYTPDGREQRDQTRIGLYFADPKSIRRTMQTGVAVNLDFVIPPGAANYQVEAHHRFDHDTHVHALTPHMHFRGKSFRFEAIYPNGSREILLDVPRYDFNWQNTYRFDQPKLLPEGTLLKCFAAFDNSEQNLANPDPSIPVKWGEQTWEEMMIGYFECVFLNQDLTLPEPRITPVGDGQYRVRFEYRPDRKVRSVNLAGTFNEWNTFSHPFEDPDRDGVFTTEVLLKEGPHRYKFVIDGSYWTHDPASRILTGFFHESFFVAGGDSRAQPASQP